MHSRETCEWKSDEKDSCKKTKRKEKQPGVRTRRPLQEHSQGGDLTTLEANSQGKDPRTLCNPIERWRVQEKQKEEKWKKRKKKTVKKTKVKYRVKSL